MIVIFDTKHDEKVNEYAIFCDVDPFRNQQEQFVPVKKIGAQLRFRHACVNKLNLIVIDGRYPTKTKASEECWEGDVGKNIFLGFLYASIYIVKWLNLDESEGVYVFSHMGGGGHKEKLQKEALAESIISGFDKLRNNWKFAFLSQYHPQRAAIFSLAPNQLKIPLTESEVETLYLRLRECQ